MKQVRYFIGFVLIASSATGQGLATMPWPDYRTLIKVAPLTIFEPRGFIQVSLEQRIRPRLSLQVSYGYGWPGFTIVPTSYLYGSNGTWQIRGEVRAYTGRFRAHIGQQNATLTTPFPVGNYWAAESYYKELNVLKYFPEGGGKPPSPIQRVIYGVNLKVGRQYAFGHLADQANRRLLVDVYTGLGVRLLNTKQRDWNEPGYARGILFDPFNKNGRQVLPTPILGVRLGYVLR